MTNKDTTINLLKEQSWYQEADDVTKVAMQVFMRTTENVQIQAKQNLYEELKAMLYEVDVDKEPSIQDEAWANQYENKCEAFWHGQAQTMKEIEEAIKGLLDKE